MADGSIVIDTKINTGDISKELKKLTAQVNGGMEAAAKGANVALAGIAAGIAGVAAASKKFADTTDRIDKMSQAVGLSRKTFQELDYTFSQNGASMDSLQMGMKTLMEQANGNAKAFSMLGVSVRKADGTLKSQDDLLKETIRAFEGMADGTEKAILAQDLFGRSAQDLMPTLNQTSGSMDELSQRAGELGLVLSDEAINAGVAFGDTMSDVQKVLAGVLNTAIAPLIPMITEAANGFISWATEGDRLGKIMQSVGETIIKTWSTGVIQTLAIAAVTVKAVTVAFGIMNAVMAANPIVLIVSAIIAAIGLLVGAVVLIYKNWDKVSGFMLITLEKIKSTFVILGSKIQEAMVVAFNGAKIALFSLTVAIYQKLFTAFVGLIDLLAKLDFAGVFTKQLAGARAEVGKWSGALDTELEKVKEESAAVVQAAKDKQNAIEAASRSNVAAMEAEQTARLAAIDKSKEEADAVIQAEGEKAAAIVSNQVLTEAQIQEKEELTNIDKKLIKQAAIYNEKVNDGLMSEQEEREELISLYKQQIDALYELGATSSGDDEKSKQLKKYKEELERLKEELERLKKAAVKPANVEPGLKEMALKVRDSAKNIIASVWQMMGKVGAVVNAAFKGVTGAFSKGFSILSKLSKFDPQAMLKSLEEFLAGLEDFFTDMALMPIWVKTGIDMIKKFLEGIMNQLPAIVETITNSLIEVSQMIIDYAPKFAKDAVTIIMALIRGIIAAAPKMIEAAATLIMSLLRGLMEAAPELIAGAFSVMLMLLKTILEILPELILSGATLVVQLITGFVDALPGALVLLADNLPLIIETILLAIPMIIEALADAFPQIVFAVLKILPMLVFAILGMIPQLLVAVVRVAWALVAGLFNGIDAAFAGLFVGIAQVFWDWIVRPVKNLFGIHSPSTVFASIGGDMIIGLMNGILNTGASLWNAVKSIFTGLMDHIKNIFAGAANLGKSLVSGIQSGISGVASAAGGALNTLAGHAGNIATGIGGAVSNAAAGVASGVGNVVKKLKFWDVGTPNVSADHMAVVHKGERIVPTTFNQDLMKGNTMMLAPEALSKMIASFTGSMDRQVVNVSGMVPVQINGKEVGRAAFEWIDVMAGGAYGY